MSPSSLPKDNEAQLLQLAQSPLQNFTSGVFRQLLATRVHKDGGTGKERKQFRQALQLVEFPASTSCSDSSRYGRVVLGAKISTALLFFFFFEGELRCRPPPLPLQRQVAAPAGWRCFLLRQNPTRPRALVAKQRNKAAPLIFPGDHCRLFSALPVPFHARFRPHSPVSGESVAACVVSLWTD